RLAVLVPPGGRQRARGPEQLGGLGGERPGLAGGGGGGHGGAAPPPAVRRPDHQGHAAVAVAVDHLDEEVAQRAADPLHQRAQAGEEWGGQRLGGLDEVGEEQPGGVGVAVGAVGTEVLDVEGGAEQRQAVARRQREQDAG